VAEAHSSNEGRLVEGNRERAPYLLFSRFDFADEAVHLSHDATGTQIGSKAFRAR
jgi:hypothetical protein